MALATVCPPALDVLNAPVTVLVGHFGAGKTEIAVNLALAMAARGDRVSVVDADLVKPYFRSRLLRDEFLAKGVELVAPGGDQFYADLPILVPEVAGAVAQAQARERRVIIDAGGADVGARVLGAIPGLTDPAVTDVLFVVNGNRPFAEDVPSIVKMLRGVEQASKLAVAALIANTHLMHETTPDILTAGLDLAAAVSAETGLPVRFWAAMAGDLTGGAASINHRDWPLLRLTRQMTPPTESRPTGMRRRSSVV